MSGIKVNDYIVCRYKGESGDVIAGQVVKIRAGKAFMKNLLTGGDSERAVDIVNRRNIVVPRKDALAVAEIFHESEDKQKARKAAVEVADRVKAEEEKAAKAEKEKEKQDGTADPAPKRRGRPPKAEAAKKATNGTNGHAKKAPKAAKKGPISVHVGITQDGKVLVDKSYNIKG